MLWVKVSACGDAVVDGNGTMTREALRSTHNIPRRAAGCRLGNAGADQTVDLDHGDLFSSEHLAYEKSE